VDTRQENASKQQFREKGKKQGAAGITTAAPYVTGLWGRGMTGCRDDAEAPGSVPALPEIILQRLFCTRLIDGGFENPTMALALLI
jgi:hypothetical protein